MSGDDDDVWFMILHFSWMWRWMQLPQQPLMYLQSNEMMMMRMMTWIWPAVYKPQQQPITSHNNMIFGNKCLLRYQKYNVPVQYALDGYALLCLHRCTFPLPDKHRASCSPRLQIRQGSVLFHLVDKNQSLWYMDVLWKVKRNMKVRWS